MTGPIPMTPPAMPTPPMQNAEALAGPTPGVEFGQKFGQSFDTSHRPAGEVPDVKRVEFKDGTNPLDAAQGLREEIARIRADYEGQVESGVIKPGDGQLQLWRLMDLQTRAQDVHFRVELVSKLVDQFAGGVKQLSQTQA